MCRISRIIPQRCCNPGGLASIPFHYFTSDIHEFDSWTEESQRFFLVLSYYHLPNQVDELLDECWKSQIQKVFTSFTSSWHHVDYFNIQELVTLSESFLHGDCRSSITKADVHHKTITYLRRIRCPTLTEEDSGIKRDSCEFLEDRADSVQYERTCPPSTKTDVSDEVEIDDFSKVHSWQSTIFCERSLSVRKKRPRLHEEAQISPNDSSIKRDNCEFPEDCAESVENEGTNSPSTKADAPFEMEIEDVSKIRCRQPTTFCDRSLSLRNKRPRLHEEAKITPE